MRGIELEAEVGRLLGRIRSDDIDERFDAAQDLGELLEEAYGEDGATIGRTLRAQGGARELVALLTEPYPEVQASVLQVIGNICSNSVDPLSHETKDLMLEAHGDRVILGCLRSDDETVLRMACAVLQNLCPDEEWASAVMRQRADVTLQALLRHDDERTRNYAAGALRNLITVQREAGGLVPELDDDAYEAIHRREMEAAIQVIRSSHALRVFEHHAKRIKQVLARRRRERLREEGGEVEEDEDDDDEVEEEEAVKPPARWEGGAATVEVEEVPWTIAMARWGSHGGRNADAGLVAHDGDDDGSGLGLGASGGGGGGGGEAAVGRSGG
eukprot:810381-Prymnesium_polylepis.1